jgi:hypothetical protein
MMILGIPQEKPFPTTSENKKNTLMVIQEWMLGPEQPSNERGANADYWNCEYYDNTPETQLKMERIPWNQWDVGAGFRGFCTKFDFCCHDLRCCQAWEEKEFEAE